MVTLEIIPDEWKTFVVGSKVTLEKFCNSDNIGVKMCKKFIAMLSKKI